MTQKHVHVLNIVSFYGNQPRSGCENPVGSLNNSKKALLSFTGIFWRERLTSTYSICKGFLWVQNKLASQAPEVNCLLLPPRVYFLCVKARRALVHTQQLFHQNLQGLLPPHITSPNIQPKKPVLCSPNTARARGSHDFTVLRIPSRAPISCS